MMNRVRSAHAWSALLLLVTACGDGGGGKKQDAGGDAAFIDDDGGSEEDATTPGGDGGGEDGPDGEVIEMDGGGGDDSSVALDGDTEDTGAGDDAGGGGGDDAGDDASTLPADCAEAEIVAANGGTITSSDSLFQLQLAGGALSGDATVRVCLVADADVPADATSDGRVGGVYLISSSATFTAGTATFTGHSALPGFDVTANFDPVTVRTLPSSGAVTPSTNAVLSLAKRATGSATTLTATIGGPGHVYVARLEAAGIYQVQLASPKTTYVTGEVIDLSALVTVGNVPAVARILEAEIQGCDLETMNTSSEYHRITETRGTRAGCARYVTITRADPVPRPPTNDWDNGFDSSTELTDGNTVDLRDPERSPPRLYCQQPGTGWGATRLLFKNGATTDLVVEKRLEVTCTYSGDLVMFHDEAPVVQSGNGLAQGSGYTPSAYIAISPPATTYETVAPDALRYAAPAAVLSEVELENDITGEGFAGTPQVATTTGTATYANGRYTTVFAPGATALFGAAENLMVRVTAEDFVECAPASASALALQLDDTRAGAASTFAITDGTVDLIMVRVRFPGTGGAADTIVQRMIDATQLGRHAAVPLLTSTQRTALASLGTASEYAVSFLRVVWDEDRNIWPAPTGRVLPVACGTTLLFEAADVVPPG